MDRINDEYYMGLALDMAEKAQGQTGTNPVVGAVVVKEGAIVGLGIHLKRGEPHAEVYALDMAGAAAMGSTVYVSLEPCSHYGMTPPCAERLIKESVARVVVACEDPNGEVAGRGIELLRQHGIEVTLGVLQERALYLNRKFFKYISTGIPFVTIKTASTLDGKIASKTGDSKWISNAASRELVHTMRHQHGGIMVGVDTVIADNPQLTTRLEPEGLSPIRIVVDSKLRIPNSSRILTDGITQSIILTTEQATQSRISELEALGATIVLCGSGSQVDLKSGLRALGKMGISAVLVEGGGRLNGAMLQHRLVDEIVLFIAPKLIGGSEAPGNFMFDGYALMQDAVTLRDMKIEQIEDNIAIRGIPVWRDVDDSNDSNDSND